jgi:hypothetical protein
MVCTAGGAFPCGEPFPVAPDATATFMLLLIERPSFAKNILYVRSLVKKTSSIAAGYTRQCIKKWSQPQKG